ncbi:MULTISPECIES: hypothetical protein [unclassified Streptomyces]|uniref:hypothetical protein n=1 Tax=unclassified Streptomyces TaxID=2593676 RepID=UPI003817F373
MAEPGSELFEAIRRDYRDGDKLPRSLAARHHVSHEEVRDVLSTVLPLRPQPAGEDELRAYAQRLDALLEEDAARPPAERRSVFELYQDFARRTDRVRVSYRWVWEYLTARRPEPAADSRPSAPPAGPQPSVRPVSSGTWASGVPVDMPSFITYLITHAAQHLTELKIEGSLPAAEGVELGMASLGQAASLISQALNELALAGRGSGQSWAQMSLWADMPEEELTQQVRDYHHLMTS